MSTFVWTALVFAGIPVLVILLIFTAVYAGSSRRSKRYRPGRPFEFTPVWFLAAPERLAEAGGGAHALETHERAALTAGADGSGKSGKAGEWPAEELVHEHATGGASDRW